MSYSLWGRKTVGHDLVTKQENESMKMIYYNFKRGIGRMAMLAMCLKLHGSSRTDPVADHTRIT